LAANLQTLMFALSQYTSSSIVDNLPFVIYSLHAMKVRQTKTFSQWLEKLRDMEARARIIIRINRFRQGNIGDVKPVGEGVGEARIAYGPGYRLYFVKRGESLIILLCGGSKKTQQRDIELAKKLRNEI